MVHEGISRCALAASTCREMLRERVHRGDYLSYGVAYFSVLAALVALGLTRAHKMNVTAAVWASDLKERLRGRQASEGRRKTTGDWF